MKIGLLSDTHGFFDPKIPEYFSQCDEIWHAGDIGDLLVAENLKRIKSLRAVYGNIDGLEIRNIFPEDLFFLCEDTRVLITHIGGVPGRYNTRAKKLLAQHKPDIFICGHSHALHVARDPSMNGMLFLNPGAAGNQGFHKMKSLLRFEISGKQVLNMEMIDLGKRGAIIA